MKREGTPTLKMEREYDFEGQTKQPLLDGSPIDLYLVQSLQKLKKEPM